MAKVSDDPSPLHKAGNEWVEQSQGERDRDAELRQVASSVLSEFGPNWNAHNLVTLKRQSLSRILYHDFLYQKIVNVPGVICEFGVQWGATLAQLINLRGIHEPFNHSRKVYGFDTFEGFPEVSD